MFMILLMQNNTIDSGHYDKLVEQVVTSQVYLTYIISHNWELCRLFAKPHIALCANCMHLK
jgi:hypothetical protein